MLLLVLPCGRHWRMATSMGESDLIFMRSVKSRPSGGCALALRCSMEGGSGAFEACCSCFSRFGFGASCASSFCGGGSSFAGGSSLFGGGSLVATEVPPPFDGLPLAVNALLADPYVEGPL